MKTYKLFINQYNIMKNDYVVREKIIKTNDIYHEIGKLYCTELCKIKRIDYQEIDIMKELKNWLKEESEFDEYKDVDYREAMECALDKIKELEEKYE